MPEQHRGFCKTLRYQLRVAALRGLWMWGESRRIFLTISALISALSARGRNGKCLKNICHVHETMNHGKMPIFFLFVCLCTVHNSNTTHTHNPSPSKPNKFTHRILPIPRQDPAQCAQCRSTRSAAVSNSTYSTDVWSSLDIFVVLFRPWGYYSSI